MLTLEFDSAYKLTGRLNYKLINQYVNIYLSHVLYYCGTAFGTAIPEFYKKQLFHTNCFSAQKCAQLF